MGGGGDDPYNHILDVCQKLNAIQPVTVVPLPLQEVRLGTFDANAGTFTWNPILPHETEVIIIPPGDGIPHPIKKTVTTYHFDSTAVTVQLLVDLVNNSSGTTFTAGDQSAFAPPNTNVVSVGAPFSGSVNFILTSGNQSAGDHVTADRSHFVNFSGSLQPHGCVVVPALPIGIAYQPPTKNGVGEFNETQSTGVSITNVTMDDPSGWSGTSSSFSEVDAAVVALQEAAAAAAIAGAAAGVANPPAGVLGAAVSAVASLLAAYLQAIKEAGAPDLHMHVGTTQTVTLTFTQENTFSSVRELGPGAGDVIIYLQDATFAVYTLNGNTTFVPLGFRGLTPIPVPGASLQPGAAQPANLPPDTRARLLALDPVASGNPDGVTDPSRYSLVGELTLPFPTPVKHCWSFSQEVSTAGPKLITYTNESGQVVSVTLGFSVGALRGSAVNTCFEVTGLVDFQVWYDSLFDVFAYRDLSPMQSSAISFEGTLPPSDLPLLGQEVTVVQNGRSVTTLTDAQGHYLVRSPSLQPGPAELLLPTSGGSPITQAINLSV